MDGVTWDDLRVFLAVAETGTLAAAGEVLGVNPSTVHRRIAGLEGTLDARLFERDPRGYALTAVGEALVPRAEEVREAVYAAERAVRGHDRSPQGSVRLTLPETLVGVVAPHLAAVRDACPGLRPILVADDRLLDLGVEADVALRPSRTPPDDAVGRKLGVVAWAVYGRAHGDADDVPWVVYAEEAGPRHARAWRLRHHGDVDVLMEVGSVGAMHRVLRCSRARGLLPCYLGDPDTRLARVGDPVDALAIDLWLLLHADLRRSARVRALVDLLVPRLEADGPLLAGTCREAVAVP